MTALQGLVDEGKLNWYSDASRIGPDDMKDDPEISTVEGSIGHRKRARLAQPNLSYASLHPGPKLSKRREESNGSGTEVVDDSDDDEDNETASVRLSGHRGLSWHSDLTRNSERLNPL